MASYGACEEGLDGEERGGSRRSLVWSPLRLAAGSAVVVGICCAVASVGSRWGKMRFELAQEHEDQTSMRTDLAHPYGTMYPANPKFINPSGQPPQAVNPLPRFPYHHGDRPKMVQNDDFEHNPFGNTLPWDEMPEGAIAKYDKRPDMMKAYRYLVNKDGEVMRWDTDLRRRDVDPKRMSAVALKHFSPVPEPEPSAQEVAEALFHMQQRAVRKSFRNILPKGAFHDSIVDAQSGFQYHVPDAAYHVPEVKCPIGLMKCPDKSCVAHMAYCPGCEHTPMPEYCASNAASPSGWRASMIGCDKDDVEDCGMRHGQGLYLPGESVSGGVITGGLGR